MSTRTFDVIVVGAGPAGEVCAGNLAQGGLATAIVERELIGGECTFYACSPSKALLRPGELAAETVRIPGVVDAAVEPIAVLRRRDEVIHDLDDSVMEPWLEDRDVTIVRGAARLIGEKRLRVGDDELIARRAVVLATGSAPSIPPVPGLAEARPWTNREITTAKVVPPRLLILGGGVVGVEMAQAWSSLGTQVTIVELSDRLIAQEEEMASEAVAKALRERGVDVRLGAHVTSARRDEHGVVLALGEEELRGDELLVAAGRHARTDGLGLETVGIEPGRTVDVDDRLQVPGYDWLYAIGDANGRALLTHEGKHHARVLARSLLGDERAALRADGPPPRAIFTDPAVACVGYTLAAARQAGIDASAVDTRIDQTAGSSYWGKGADAFARFVIDDARGVLVGATFVGPDVAEFVHAATIAVVGEVPLERIAYAVPPFPTRSEVWLQLVDRPGAP